MLGTITLLSIWYHSGEMLAYAETGLPLYNPTRTLNIYKNVLSHTQFGHSNPFIHTMITFFAFASFLSSLGLQPDQI